MTVTEKTGEGAMQASKVLGGEMLGGSPRPWKTGRCEPLQPRR